MVFEGEAVAVGLSSTYRACKAQGHVLRTLLEGGKLRMGLVGNWPLQGAEHHPLLQQNMEQTKAAAAESVAAAAGLSSTSMEGQPFAVSFERHSRTLHCNDEEMNKICFERPIHLGTGKNTEIFQRT